MSALTFRYWRLEKILPQPGKSQGSSSRLAALLWGRTGRWRRTPWLSSASLPPSSQPRPQPLPKAYLILLGPMCSLSSSRAKGTADGA